MCENKQSNCSCDINCKECKINLTRSRYSIDFRTRLTLLVVKRVGHKSRIYIYISQLLVGAGSRKVIRHINGKLWTGTIYKACQNSCPIYRVFRKNIKRISRSFLNVSISIFSPLSYA